MNRRDFIRTTLAGTVSGLAGSLLTGCEGGPAVETGPVGGRRPNIVLIMTDDQGYGDLGCYHAKGFTTPNIDALARAGMRFSDFYAAAPLCSPTRASLLTGCYPQRVGLPDVLDPDSGLGISDQELTLAQMLKRVGYRTACFGKWHLGTASGFLATDKGFDEFFGLPYSNDMISSIPENAFYNFPDHLPLMEGDRIIGYDPDQTQLTASYTRRAVQFIKKNRDRPFFLYFPHSMPHAPISASGRFRGRSRKGMYGDVMMEIDWSVGQVLAALEQQGLSEDTMVIFLSDNGPALVYGEWGGSAGPLREGKLTAFEGGQRVPMIVSWPGRIRPGTVTGELASTNDILPTVAAITGAPLSPNPIDGRSIWPVLSGQGRSPHDEFYYYFGLELHAVRQGKWKLHFPHTFPSVTRPGWRGHPGEQEWRSTEEALYDLSSDIGEENDLSEQYPGVVARLKDRGDRMRASLGDHIEGIEGRDRRPAGGSPH